MGNEAPVDSVKISDAEPTVVFVLADVIPRPEVYGRGGVILLNASPPESSYDGINSFHKSPGEKNSRHVIDRNGR